MYPRISYFVVATAKLECVTAVQYMPATVVLHFTEQRHCHGRINHAHTTETI